jgi:hypothetical protein
LKGSSTGASAEAQAQDVVLQQLSAAAAMCAGCGGCRMQQQLRLVLAFAENLAPCLVKAIAQALWVWNSSAAAKPCQLGVAQLAQ